MSMFDMIEESFIDSSVDDLSSNAASRTTRPKLKEASSQTDIVEIIDDESAAGEEESAAREKEESAARERGHKAKNRKFSDKAAENSAHLPKVSLSVSCLISAVAVSVTVTVAIIVGLVVYSTTNHCTVCNTTTPLTTIKQDFLSTSPLESLRLKKK